MNARLVTALLLLAGAAGCVDNNASVRLSAACFPPTPSDTGGCSYSTSCTSVMMDNLWVDATYVSPTGTSVNGLIWPFQVDNQRPSNGAPADGSTNTASAFITAYQIAYFSSAIALPTITIDDTTRLVEAASSQVVSIPVVPPSVALLLGGVPAGTQLRAEIRAKGHFGDGQSFETGPFSVVVFVDNGRGSGAYCPDPAKIIVAGQCPQDGQSNVTLCK